MKQQTLFPTNNLVQKKSAKPKVKYLQSKTAKQRYNLTQRVKQAGVVIDAKTRTINPESVKQADPTTRKRIRKLMNHGYGIELKINYQE